MTGRRSGIVKIGVAFVIVLVHGVCDGAADPPTIGSVSEFSPHIPQEWLCFDGLEKMQQDERKAAEEANEARKNRWMDIYSWKMFVALNWPVGLTGGSPRDPRNWVVRADAFPVEGKVNDFRLGAKDRGGYVPRWITWAEKFEIFGKGKPVPGSEFRGFDTNADRTGYPLVDQNGNKVYYEILINPGGLETALALNTLGEQKSFNRRVIFPSGQCARLQKDGSDPSTQEGRSYDFQGVIEIKLAWKILRSGDDARLFLKKMLVIREGTRWVRVMAGLVGMHIANKTVDHPQWIWSTFEHVYNAPSHNLSAERKRPWSFYNPRCRTCPVNCPPVGAGEKTQLTRTEEIRQDTAELNRTVRTLLHEQKSILKYYQLIGTQYIPPNVSPSIVEPPVLRNTVIEPYITRMASLCENLPHPLSHQDSSCIGCHKNASIPRPECVRGQNQRADFSFLLENGPYKSNKFRACEPIGNR